MSKEEIFQYIDVNGYTKASIEHATDFPKEVVLEHLSKYHSDDEEFKIKFIAHYTEIIEEHFK